MPSSKPPMTTAPQWGLLHYILLRTSPTEAPDQSSAGASLKDFSKIGSAAELGLTTPTLSKVSLLTWGVELSAALSAPATLLAGDCAPKSDFLIPHFPYALKPQTPR